MDQSNIPSELRYENFVGLIKSMASKYWNLRKDPAVTFDDLVGEGNLIYCLTLRSHLKDDKGLAFSTRLTNNIINRYNTIHRNRSAKKRVHEKAGLDEIENLKSEDGSFHLIENILSLSKEGRFLFNIIAKAPDELMELGGYTKGALAEYLNKFCGFSTRKAQKLLKKGGL